MSAPTFSLILLSIVAVLAILFVHELGHLIVARWCGRLVLRVSVGFGPELLALTDRHGTRWALAALPFGGCIKMNDDPSAPAAGKALSQRAAIFAAGPMANLVLAGVVYGLSLALFGEAALLPSLSERPAIFIASLLSGFSLVVALFNLLPILPLDGGRLVMIGIEAVMRKPIPEPLQRTLCSVGSAIMIVIPITIGAYGIYVLS